MGVIFSIGTDGANYTVLHKFVGGYDGGANPRDGLIYSGGKLYGGTNYGGDTSGDNSGNGVVFSFDPNTKDFTVLRRFQESGPDDGENPSGDLTLSGAKLFGVTQQGGASNWGTIFSVDTDGNNFTLLHEFTNTTTDGSSPYDKLLLSNGLLYGVGGGGGIDNDGVVYSISTDGTGFTLLHEFDYDDGANPEGNLVQSGSTLYGMTETAGDNNYGVILSAETDGSNFSVMRHLSYDDGGHSLGGFTLSGDTLYGMTWYGGAYGYGTIISINITGENFTVVHAFEGSTDDGGYPYGNLTIIGNTVYGMTYNGGVNNDGIIFKYEPVGDGGGVIPEPSTIILVLLSFLGMISKHFFKKR
ncbi:choice-of-anchor tandem repeat GloVer-containing protein [Chlamydiota bacterium]